MEWLGEVPEGWELLRTKQLAKRIQTGSTPPTQERHYYENGSVPWFGPGSFSTDLLLDKPIKVISKIAVKDGVARIFKGQSTMIVTIGATIGKVGYIESSASSNQQITVVTFDITRANPKFAAYQMKRLEPVLRGIAPNTTLPILNQDDIGHLPFCLPSLSEQRAIAAFLDSETGRIDALIEKKERQIELLQEKRAALISHAVTKGLDPDVKTEDSGVEWLGEVPEHWPVERLRFHILINPTKSEVHGLARDTTVSFVPMEAVREYGGIRLGQTRPIEEVAAGYTYFRDGDVAVAKITPCFENVKGAVVKGLKNGIGFGTTELHVLRPSFSIDQHFLFYLTISYAFRKLGESEMYGSAGQKRVPEDFIKNLKHPIPILAEQRSIAVFLDRETGHIDVLTTKVYESISKLREYRTALISAAVTGKIDVRSEET